LGVATTDDLSAWQDYIDEEWLAWGQEEILEPDLPVIDPHHHVWWDRPLPYRFEHFLADLASGHNLRATVYMESSAMYRADGPEHLRAVGETEYANGLAAMSASGRFGPVRACAGIVGHCDLTGGKACEELLMAHIAAGNGRFRGVRINPYIDFIANGRLPAKGILSAPDFRRGFARLAPLGLVADAMCLHTQLLELVDLAQTFPDTTIVLDHVGGPTTVGSFAGHRQEIVNEWVTGMQALARCPNVAVKLGGLTNPFLCNINFRSNRQPPSSQELAQELRPWMEPAISWFGPERCMFESNFPPDKYNSTYAMLWNAFKRIAQPCSAGEKKALFFDTAARVYGLAVSPS
jgi:predicted TIM-barrel fold metal-dependent hydrolase